MPESVLLTDEAIRSAARTLDLWSDDALAEAISAREMAEKVLRGVLHLYATEGRESLVEKVAKVIAADCASAPSWPLFTEQAEAVVTALFGPLELSEGAT